MNKRAYMLGYHRLSVDMKEEAITAVIEKIGEEEPSIFTDPKGWWKKEKSSMIDEGMKKMAPWLMGGMAFMGLSAMGQNRNQQEMMNAFKAMSRTNGPGPNLGMAQQQGSFGQIQPDAWRK